MTLPFQVPGSEFRVRVQVRFRVRRACSSSGASRTSNRNHEPNRTLNTNRTWNLEHGTTGSPTGTPAPGTGTRRCCLRVADASSTASSGRGPKFSRSMCTASSSRRLKDSLQVIAVQTSVGPIASSIFDSGHSTTVTNGNMNSFFTIGGLGRAGVDHGRQQVVRLPVLDEPLRSRYFAVTSVDARRLEDRRRSTARSLRRRPAP